MKRWVPACVGVAICLAFPACARLCPVRAMAFIELAQTEGYAKSNQTAAGDTKHVPTGKLLTVAEFEELLPELARKRDSAAYNKPRVLHEYAFGGSGQAIDDCAGD